MLPRPYTWRELREVLDTLPDNVLDNAVLISTDEDLMHFIVDVSGFDDCSNIYLVGTQFVRRN